MAFGRFSYLATFGQLWRKHAINSTVAKYMTAHLILLANISDLALSQE
jgi:hypothetical protein